MKTTIYIIIMLSFFLISCNRRERQLEGRLVATEHSLNESNVELLKALQGVQNLIEENENLKNEIDDLKSKNEKITKRNEDLAIENNDLRNENDNLSNKLNEKVISGKIQVKPSFSSKTAKESIKENSVNKKTNITVTNNEIKSFLNECKKTIKGIQNYLFRLRDADLKPLKSKHKLGDFWYNMQISSRVSDRKVFCRVIVNDSTRLHYNILRKIKNLPEDNSTIQYRRILNSIDQNLKIIIDCCKIHTQLTTKGEMDTCTTNAFQAVERINSIIDNF